MKEIFTYIFILLSIQVTAQVIKHDGPYIFKEGYTEKAYTIRGGQLKQETLPEENRMTKSFHVATDIEGRTFEIWLKPGLSFELASYEMPEKLVAISDIEGNFGPFRKLLQATGVIDSDLNWSFGEGHLVLTGDFFDRGSMVTEVLWFIYKLEWEAQQAGGYIHFILGNHEIMNLRGDLRYVHNKYKESAKKINKALIDLYGVNTELGQWVRTKNMVEKIGDYLFVHAGISEAVNQLDISLTSMNHIARPYYDQKVKSYENVETAEMLMSHLGPLWYRGYYKSPMGKPISMEIIDQTLKQFSVSKIITGHTLVADTISTHYKGKVINIDTHHSSGKSEALLIDKDNYYRVDINGKKYRLFKR